MGRRHHESVILLKKCPFYGFRWPDRQLDLYQVEGAECGLDLDQNGPCKRESVGLTVDFYCCEVAAKARMYLKVGADRIRFHPVGVPVGIGLKEWTHQTTGGAPRSAGRAA
jgi:hypothetical protein